jgi:hypothetical protein
MRQASRTVAIALASIVVVAGQALAFQCPSLIKKIDTETAIRFDPAAADAKVKAVQAGELHAKGDHAGSEAAAKEGLKLLGLDK